MRCASCSRPGAFLRWMNVDTYFWFHALCWAEFRKGLREA